MIKNYFLGFLALVCMTLTMASCQSTEHETDDNVRRVSLNLHVAQFEQVPFDQAVAASRATDVSQVCSHLCFAIYDMRNKLVESVTQNVGDPTFGQVSLSLNAGSYRVVVLAHSSSIKLDLSNPENIGFGDDVTDTFYDGEVIKVDNENVNREIQLRRVVTKFELVTTDNVPTKANYVSMSYKGGMGCAFDAVKGVGVNAAKGISKNLTADEIGKPITIALYAFPLSEEETTTEIMVSFKNINIDFDKSRTFSNVPVQRNVITRYTGNFFSNAAFAVSMTSIDNWGNRDVNF